MAPARRAPLRVLIYVFTSGFLVVRTYAPNNGSDAESFARRAQWDEAMLQVRDSFPGSSTSFLCYTVYS